MRAHRELTFRGEVCLLALFFSASAAAETLSSSGYEVRPARDNAGGGDGAVSASAYSASGSVGEAQDARMQSASYRAGSGMRQVLHYPGRVSDLTPNAAIYPSSGTLDFTAPGVDGAAGDLPAGSSFYLVMSTASGDSFDLAAFNLVATTAGSVAAAAESLRFSGLENNTTYYGHLWVVDPDGNASYMSGRATWTPLAFAPRPLAAAFNRIYPTSVTVSWVGLPHAPPDASSKTSGGFLLEAADTADFSSTIYSSQTYDSGVSTLTVGLGTPLAYCTTYWFRVAALNWAGQKNYALWGSTATDDDRAVSVSTHNIDLNDISWPMNYSVVVTTSFLVLNTGNCPVTYLLSVATVTSGSPWAIASSPGLDQLTVSAGFNPLPPPWPVSGDFGAEDVMSDSEQASTVSRFALGTTGYSVGRGASRYLWFKIDTPTLTSTEAPQDLQVTVRARKEPP